MTLGIIINIKEEIGDFFKFTEVEDLGLLLTNIISASISIAFILVLIYLIWSGIQWLTSGGEKTAVAAARERMTAAFIGLMIVLSAWAIFILVKYLFGLPTGIDSGNGGSEGFCPAGQYDCCQLIRLRDCCGEDPEAFLLGGRCRDSRSDCPTNCIL